MFSHSLVIGQCGVGQHLPSDQWHTACLNRLESGTFGDGRRRSDFDEDLDLAFDPELKLAAAAKKQNVSTDTLTATQATVANFLVN